MGLQQSSVICILAIFLGGCGPSPERMRKTLIQNAKSQIPCVKEFHQLWPTAGIGVYSRQFQKDTTQVQLTEVIYDRYRLTLTIGMEVNPRTLVIKSYDAPLITLVEDTSVLTDAQSGQIKEFHGTNIHISAQEWRRIVEARGEFCAAGIQLKTNEPVAGISEVKERVRMQ